MYKCSECGNEYKIKPDFCECGNDIFECLEEGGDIKPYSHFRFDRLNILSLVIFIFCLILSFLVLLYFPKIDEDNNEQRVVKNVVSDKNIPGLDSFWIDYVPEVIKEEPVKISLPVNSVAEKQKLQQVKVTKQKTQVKDSSGLTKSQPVRQVQNQQVKQKPKQLKNPSQQVKTVQRQRTTSSNIEMLNYLNGLKYRFKSNIPFSEIDGEGTCCVEFYIDANGKLEKRNFSSQAENKSVNDAVYKMLMRTPRYDAPPASYNGGKIKAVLKLSPTYFEISVFQ